MHPTHPCQCTLHCAWSPTSSLLAGPECCITIACCCVACCCVVSCRRCFRAATAGRAGPCIAPCLFDRCFWHPQQPLISSGMLGPHSVQIHQCHTSRVTVCCPALQKSACARERCAYRPLVVWAGRQAGVHGVCPFRVSLRPAVYSSRHPCVQHTLPEAVDSFGLWAFVEKG